MHVMCIKAYEHDMQWTILKKHILHIADYELCIL